MTRTEYDDLKARFDQLEATVQRILPATYAMPSASHPSTVSPTITGAAASPGEPAQPSLIQPYRPRGSAASSYASDMPSPPSSSARGGEPPYHHSPIPMPRAIQHVMARPRSPPYVYQSAPPVPVQTSYASRAPQRSPRALSHSPPPSRAPEASRAPSTRRVSISLMELTSPTHVTPYAAAAPPASYGQQQQQQQQPKNRHAQTAPPLGRRLRQALRAHIGSAAGLPRRHIGRQARPLPVPITPPRTTPLTARLRLMTTRRRNRTRHRARMLPPITDASPVTTHGVTLIGSECSPMLLRNACYVGG